MSTDWFKDVKDFHDKYECYRGDTPSFPPHDVMMGRIARVREEISELYEAIEELDLRKIAAESIDVVYVIMGLFLAIGVDPRPLWDAIHEANMRKTGNGKNGAKVMKPHDWTPAPIRDLLIAQGFKC